MDEAWELELNGSQPSYQEYLAAVENERERFVDEYMASRGLSPECVDRETLVSLLTRAATAWTDSPAQAQRLLDAFIRVRPELVMRSRRRDGHDHTA